MLKSMKDMAGKDVVVGDHIFYSTTGRYPESRICRVLRFTEKSIFARILKHNRQANSYGSLDEVIVQNDFIKIDYQGV